MAFAQFLLPLQSPTSMGTNRLFLSLQSPPHSLRRSSPNNLSTTLRKTQLTARAEQQESSGSLAADAFTNVKHVLLPITDRNPYLSEGTRQDDAEDAEDQQQFREVMRTIKRLNLLASSNGLKQKL